MAFLHRKLLPDSVNVTITAGSVDGTDELCYLNCLPSNASGHCSPSCVDECPSVCQYEVPSPPLNYHDGDRTKKILVFTTSICASIILLACLIVLFTRLRSRLRSRSRITRSREEQGPANEEFIDEDRGPIVDHPIWYIRTVGLNPAVIGSIPVCKFKRRDGLVEGTDCSVCLSEFQEDEILRLLPKCNHAFHLPCIDTWLRSHTNCPLCRAPILSAASAAAPSSSSGANRPSLEESGVSIPEQSDEHAGEQPVESDIQNVSEDGERRDDHGNNNNSEDNAKAKVRRSVSLDSLSALRISFAVLSQEKFDNNSTDIKSEKGSAESNSSRNPTRSNNLPVFLKRSFSCSGKSLLTKYSRSRSDQDQHS